MRASFALALLLALVAAPPIAQAELEPAPPSIRIVEIVADPQRDWNQDGILTASDEFVELWNAGNQEIDLAGWRLELNDTTPEVALLEGVMEPGARLAVWNPPGQVNNNANVRLVDAQGDLVDEVSYGSFDETATVPDANADDAWNEALYEDDGSWLRGVATPNLPPGSPMPDGPHGQPIWVGAASPVEVSAHWLVDGDGNASWTLTNESGVTSMPANATLDATGWHAQTTVNVAEATRVDLQWHPGEATPTGFLAALIDVDDEPPRYDAVDPRAVVVGENPVMSVSMATDEGSGVAQAWVEWVNASANLTHAVALDPGAKQVPVPIDSFVPTHATFYAEDAVGNANATQPVGIDWDWAPPNAPTDWTATGYESVTLTWQPPTDDVGVASLLLERVVDNQTQRDWHLGANATQLIDVEAPQAPGLAYDVTVIDHAGRQSETKRWIVDHEGAYPHVVQLRTKYDPWGPGTQRVHVDFDRPMNTSVEPQLALGGQRLEGRWLANASTYLAEASDAGAFENGTQTLEVDGGVDPLGQRQWAPHVHEITVDHDVPRLDWERADSWMGPTGLGVTATDDQDPDPVVHYRINGGPWSAAQAEARIVASEGDRVEAYAKDAAGWKSTTRQRTPRIDADAPQLHHVGWDELGVNYGVRALDNASGVDPNQTRILSGGAPTTCDWERTCWIMPEPNATVALRLVDRVGNANETIIVLDPAPVPSAPVDAGPVADQGSAGAHAWTFEPGAATETTPAQGDHSLRALAPWFLILGAAPGVWPVVRRIRRQRPTPSLAARIHQARLADTVA